jgi:putative membrane protein
MAGFCFWGVNRQFRFADRRIVRTFAHDPEKACPALDAGCVAVFRKDHAQAIMPRTSRGTLSMILQSLAGLPAFLVYFCTAIIAVIAYLLVYTRITPHNEFQLIRDNDPAAAIALGLSLLGFTLPVVSAIAHAANVVDCLIWSMVALIVQVIVFYVVRIPVPNLSQRIAAGELAPAIWLGLSSLAAGALNAASMIY